MKNYLSSLKKSSSSSLKKSSSSSNTLTLRKTTRVLPNKSKSLKKTLSGILTKKTKSKKSKHVKYEGYVYEILFGILYLLKKHKNIALAIGKINMQDMNNILYNNILSWDVKNNKYTISYPVHNNNKNNYLSILKQISKNRRFAFNLLYISWGEDMGSGHFNVILYDFKKKSAERFEPLNQTIYNEGNYDITDNFDNEFEKIIKTIGLKYYRPESFVPFVNLQDIEEEHDKLKVKDNSNENSILSTDIDGYCGIWCLYYIDLRLNNPKVKKEKLLIQLVYVLKRNKFKLRRFIRNYTDYILKYLKKFEDNDEFKKNKKQMVKIYGRKNKTNPIYFKHVIYPVLKESQETIFSSFS
jgi:hypothetical protein